MNFMASSGGFATTKGQTTNSTDNLPPSIHASGRHTAERHRRELGGTVILQLL
jgi:hypothetical protein